MLLSHFDVLFDQLLNSHTETWNLNVFHSKETKKINDVFYAVIVVESAVRYSLENAYK